MEAQKPLEQETPETTPQEVPTATIPQPESTPAANMEADPVPEEMDASPKSPAKKPPGSWRPSSAAASWRCWAYSIWFCASSPPATAPSSAAPT